MTLPSILVALDPGPIPPITSGWLNQTLSVPDFSTETATDLAGIGPLLIAMDLLLDPNIPVDLFPPNDNLDIILDAADVTLSSLDVAGQPGVNNELDTADLTNAQMNAFDPVAEAAPIDAKRATADQGFLVTGGVMPGEAYQPVPASMLGPSVGGPPIGTTIKTGEMTNITDPTNSDFTVGDTYQLEVSLLAGPGGAGVVAGVECIAYTWFNSTPNNGLDLGSTDANGFLIAQGNWGPGAVGAWGLEIVLNFPDGSQQWIPVIYWNVYASTAPLTGQPTSGQGITYSSGFYPTLIQGNAPPSDYVQVSLVNLTNPGAANFAVGDQWELTVTGEPLQDVLISAFQNGNIYPWVLLGQTDQTGTFVLDGQMPDPSYVGAWTEFYQVGSVVYGGDLQFNVTP